MYVDVKVTVWQRMHLNEEGATLNDIKKTIEEGGVGSLWNREDCDIYWETMV